VIDRTTILWGLGAQFLTISSGLVLLPVLLHYLSPAELGLWYVFAALASLNQLIELGFHPTIVRHASYVYGGATQLRASGLEVQKALVQPTEISIKLLGQLLSASSYIYQRVALISVVVILFGGGLYISSLQTEELAVNYIWCAWILYASGLIITSYYAHYTAFLQGRGDITLSNKVVVYSRIIHVCVGIITVIAGFGLLGLGVAVLLSSIFSRYLSYRYFYDTHLGETTYLRSNPRDRADLVGKLWFTASRLGAVNLGAFLILKANTLIASSFFGLSVVASYGVTLQVLGAITGIATVMQQLLIPKMNFLQVNNKIEELRRAFSVTVVSAWMVCICGFLLIILFGNQVLAWLGSQIEFLSLPLLVVLSIVLLLEMNHSLAASYLTTLNEVPFLRAALVSGVAIVVLSLSSTIFLGTGLWTLIVIQGCVQGVFNNWYWPRAALNQLGLSNGSMILCGLTNIKSAILK